MAPFALNPGAGFAGPLAAISLLLAGLFVGAACDPGPAPAPRPPVASTPAAVAPAPSPTPVLPPAAYLLTPAQVGVPRQALREHLGYLQAASEERNQATALELYRTFDWADEAEATYGANSRTATLKVLVSLRTVGARNAFAYWTTLTVREPLLAAPCPTGLGLDQCAEGRAGSQWAAAGRRGVVVFYLATTGIDVNPLLRAEAFALSAGRPA